MSKLISLGLLALLLPLLASPGFAGNVEECEVLKGGATKGLYNLCLHTTTLEAATPCRNFWINTTKRRVLLIQ